MCVLNAGVDSPPEALNDSLRFLRYCPAQLPLHLYEGDFAEGKIVGWASPFCPGAGASPKCPRLEKDHWAAHRDERRVWRLGQLLSGTQELVQVLECSSVVSFVVASKLTNPEAENRSSPKQS